MRYYIESGGRALGPFELATMREMLSKGKIRSDAQISADMVSWKKATEFTELFGPAAPQTPRQTPQPPQPPPAPAPVQIQEPPASAPPTPPPLPKEFQLHAERKVHSAKKPKGELPQKMSSRYFWSWLTLSMGLFFGFLALLFLAIFNERLSPGLVLFIQGLGLASYAFVFCSLVLALMFLHAFWRAIPAELQRVPPDVAIGFLFVPLWQFYWLFVVLVSGAESMNAALAQHGLPNQRARGVPTSLAVGAAICLLVFPLQLVGVVLFYSVGAKMLRAADQLDAVLNP